MIKRHWAPGLYCRCINLVGISGKQTGLSFRKASLNVSPRIENNQHFCKSLITEAKKTILIEEYGKPTSHAGQMTARPFKKYNENGDPDTGKKFVTSLKEGRRKRWSEEIAALDFTHSSRRAWSLLRKLGVATHSQRQSPKVTANELAHQLGFLNGSVKKDRKQGKTY